MFMYGMHSGRLSRLVQRYDTLVIATEVLVVFAQYFQVDSGMMS